MTTHESTEPPAPREGAIVVIGEIEVSRLTCTALTEEGHRVVHLLHPSDQDLSDALTGEVVAVAVLVRGDVQALRYALLAEHLLPRVPLVVTLFDRTVGAQLVHVVPNCLVTSPADTSVPSIIGACLGDDVLAVDATVQPAAMVRAGPDGTTVTEWTMPGSPVRSVFRMLRGQLRAHDESALTLLLGLLGLALVLMVDLLIGVVYLHESPMRATYTAVRVLATVGPANDAEHVPGWYLVVGSLLMLATIAFTAIFTAGVVNRLLAPRHTSILGRRTVPTSGHVVVIGLGQVGVRLCIKLRMLGIPVLAVERDAASPNLGTAKRNRIPVLIGNGADRDVLERLSLGRARALAAMGSDDLDNIEVAIAALAVAPDLRVVLRAGEGDVIAETQSLFRIGQVRDVSSLTAAAVAAGLCGMTPRFVFPRDHRTTVLHDAGERVCGVLTRCSC